jgi:hypothetical protein
VKTLGPKALRQTLRRALQAARSGNAAAGLPAARQVDQQARSVRSGIVLLSLRLRSEGVRALDHMVPVLLQRHPGSPAVVLLARRYFALRGDRRAALELVANSLVRFADRAPVLLSFGEFLCNIGQAELGLQVLHMARMVAQDLILEQRLNILEAALRWNLHELDAARELILATDLTLVQLPEQCSAALTLARLLDFDGHNEAALEVLEPYQGIAREGAGANSSTPRPAHQTPPHLRPQAIPQLASVRLEHALLALNQATDSMSGAELDAIDSDIHSDPIGQARLFFRLGDLPRGWRHWERRLDSIFFASPVRQIDAPRWRGEPLRGKRIFIWAEQGLGDQIMFASLLPEIIAAGAQITLECSPKLVALFSASFPGCAVRDIGPDDGRGLADYRGFDYHAAIGSLGVFLRPSLEHFPRGHRWLRGEPSPAAAFDPTNGPSGRPTIDPLIEPPGRRIRVGLAWSSGERSAFRDRNYLELADCLPWLTDPRIDPVCLNYKVSASELEQIKGEPALRNFIAATVDQFNDLVGCANLIESCDVIVGAATTNTALAAACNKPLMLCMAHPERAIFGFGTCHYPFWNWAPAVKIAGRTRSDVVDELFQRGLALVGVHLPPKIATI